MNLENTKDLRMFFSEENLNFLKNMNEELSKIEMLLEKNQSKEEKYSLFLTALTTKDFSNTNKEYFLDVKNIYDLLEKNTALLKNLKSTLSALSTKLLALVLSDTNSNTPELVNEINNNLNRYIELLDEMKTDFIQNNLSINTFTSYHSTRLLLTTFDMDLGENLDESINLISPNSTTSQIDTSYSDMVGTNENKVLIISYEVT